MDTLVDFLGERETVLVTSCSERKGDSACDFLFTFLYRVHFRKGVCPIRETFASQGANSSFQPHLTKEAKHFKSCLSGKGILSPQIWCTNLTVLAFKPEQMAMSTMVNLVLCMEH